jgi:hypothetical protein
MECALGQMVIALLLLLAVPANAQESIFRDAGGNFVRSARVDPQGTTIFRDRSGNAPRAGTPKAPPCFVITAATSKAPRGRDDHHHQHHR